MTVVDRDQFMRALDDAGLDEDAVREGYSGRGMYGKECLAIVVDNVAEAMLFAAALAASDADWEFIGNTRTDSIDGHLLARVTLDGEEDV